MELPDITHLQFLILGFLCDRQDYSGRSIRDWLAEKGIARTLPAFYRLMGRMEKAAYVKGWDEVSRTVGKALPPRYYRITKLGQAVWEEYRAFSLSAGAKGGDAGPFSRVALITNLVADKFSQEELDELTTYLSNLKHKKKSKPPNHS